MRLVCPYFGFYVRFYCVSGKIKHQGVYHLPASWSVEKILQETDNLPTFKFFVQVGGSASGLVINCEQIKKQKMIGAGSIEVYPATVKPRKVLLKWFAFYQKESCGKCTPCRMGSYQLYELVKNNKKVAWPDIFDIVKSMKETSFCALGKSISVPVESYYKNILGRKIPA